MCVNPLNKKKPVNPLEGPNTVPGILPTAPDEAAISGKVDGMDPMVKAGTSIGQKFATPQMDPVARMRRLSSEGSVSPQIFGGPSVRIFR